MGRLRIWAMLLIASRAILGPHCIIDSLRSSVLRYLLAHRNTAFTAREIVENMGLPYTRQNECRFYSLLSYLSKSGDIEKPGRGRYQFPATIHNFRR